MRVVVGLGNPGEEYAHTRHNAGFEVVDLLASEWGVTYWKNTCGALVGEGKLRHSDGSVEKVILAKPQSFMNLSGGRRSCARNTIARLKSLLLSTMSLISTQEP